MERGFQPREHNSEPSFTAVSRRRPLDWHIALNPLLEICIVFGIVNGMPIRAVTRSFFELVKRALSIAQTALYVP